MDVQLTQTRRPLNPKIPTLASSSSLKKLIPISEKTKNGADLNEK
jgi:hypothetical protein